MSSTDPQGAATSAPEVALIVGGGPGISASCARLFAQHGLAVAMAARNPDKPVLQALVQAHGVRTYRCDAAEPADVATLFDQVTRDLGAPRLVVHNIDGRVPGIFRKGITEADPTLALDTLRNAAFSAFLVQDGAALIAAQMRPPAPVKRPSRAGCQFPVFSGQRQRPVRWRCRA